MSSRRQFLTTSAATASALALTRIPAAFAAPTASPLGTVGAAADAPFALGVASGDPLPDSIILWTRLSILPQAPDGGVPNGTYDVEWEIAEDEGFGTVVGSGTVATSAAKGYSVHVDATGLEPARAYWYRFRALGVISPAGRTKTAPAAGQKTGLTRIAFGSCQNYSGYFVPYQYLAADDVDVFFHLGDYIYESLGVRTGTPLASPEPTDLDGYRWRWAEYKADPDLRAAHATVPFVCTWDDHEVDNDYAGDHGQGGDDPEVFRARRFAAHQAFYENLPLRTPDPMGGQLKLFRRLTYGDLVRFHVLDNRSYRDNHACEGPGGGGGRVISADCPDLTDPSRTMLGFEQEAWLHEGLRTAPTRWNVVAQQLLFSQLEQIVGPEQGRWVDGWDGYAATRQRLVDVFAEERVANPLLIGGDIHNHWVADVKTNYDDPSSATVASEFVGTSISSNGSSFDRYLPENPHILFHEYRYRGYGRLSLTHDEAICDFPVVSSVSGPTSDAFALDSWAVEAGSTGAHRV
ncbi:alkaline phosphatase D family protein [Euzebya pacifica]|uniref:alkaline phosphatase D family protein n=1 Tax=Euzebya pacifica TaxID=1608957 RepID=UPI0030FD0FD7